MTEITLIILATISGVSFFSYKAIKNASIKKEPVTLSMNDRVLSFLKQVAIGRQEYFTKTIKDKLFEDYRDVYDFFNKHPYSKIKNPRLSEFKEIFSKIDTFIKKWNEEYITKELVENKVLFDNIDGKSLDDQQRRAVVVDEINNLVLAGAGSGKTLTISGKVKYLVDTKNIKPEEILLLSYTKKAAEEMFDRISQKLHINIESKTFHKLGLDIIKKHQGMRFDIAEEHFLSDSIEEYFNKTLYNDKEQVLNIITFFGCYLNIPKDWEEFENLGEYVDYYRNIDFETLKGKTDSKRNVDSYAENLRVNKQTLHGETVKSLEEVMIANYLFLNGINYIYEYKYPFESPDKYRKAYRPDFYLPDHDIYLEHFGITKDNRVPWLTQIEEQKYLDGIVWKRAFHKQNKTKLLETYSYYNKEGGLLIELERILKGTNVKFKEVDYVKIYEQIFDKTNNRFFTEFKKLISSFIVLFKSNGYSIEHFNELNKEVMKIKNSFLRERSSMFIGIVEPIFVKYQEELQSSEKIDFNDMINLATDIVKNGKAGLRYKYIIIDEYQDISVSRFNLIREIKNRTDAKVMCVGDDWQSIYRFAGSDIDLFTNFKSYFGYYELLKIEKTYRNSQELINIAGKLVMKNPKQLKKDLKSDKHHSNPLRILGYEKDSLTAIKNAINEIVHRFGTEADITILGRNNFDIDFIKDSCNGEFKLVKTKAQVLVKYSKYPDLKINFLTVHRSKGLEASNVIIINLENKLLGFPNKISDDPILSLVLTDVDEFTFAEEKRLFYVALTRTKNITYLIVPDKNQSVFVQEIIKDFKIQYEFSTQEQTINENPNCPHCQKGHLVIREDKNNRRKFLGCTNYPICDSTLNDIEIINDQIKCRSCGGYMSKRRGTYGEFYGCTNFPLCKSTIKVEPIVNNYSSKKINFKPQYRNYNIAPTGKSDSLRLNIDESKLEGNLYGQMGIEQEKDEMYLQTYEEYLSNLSISKNDK